jgi:fumarate reductase subunit D
VSIERSIIADRQVKKSSSSSGINGQLFWVLWQDGGKRTVADTIMMMDFLFKLLMGKIDLQLHTSILSFVQFITVQVVILVNIILFYNFESFCLAFLDPENKIFKFHIF